MNFPCDCPACGCANPVDFSEIGRRIYCRGCGTPMVVPAPMEVVGPAAPQPAIVKFRCPACRRKFATRADLAGKKIRCNRCGAGVRVPSADGAVPVGHAGASSHSGPVPIHAATGAPTHPGTDDAVEVVPSLFDDLEAIQGIDQPRHAGTVLPSRSEAMEEVRRQSEEEAAANREKAEKAANKKRRRKKSGYFDAKETLKLVAGVGALVVVLALVAWGYPDFRFPLGGLLCVLGFITYLLGITSLRQQVAEEGVFAALLFRFFPPYQWWYVVTRWQDTKDYVAFFGAGMLILSIGGAIIKTSPIGIKAMAADRAFEKAKRGNQDGPPPPAVPARPLGEVPRSTPDPPPRDDD